MEPRKPGLDESLDATRALYARLGGTPTVETTRVDEVLARLAAGRGPLAAELPWEEGADGAVAATRQVLLTGARDGRVFFANSVPDPAPAGTALGGPGQGPLRRAEGTGESMTVQDFQLLWSRGARALLEP